MQRQAWLPYFTGLNAIIFLAPISCFDERLAEDPRVNRLEDSLILWKTIVSSDVLRGVQLILVRFLHVLSRLRSVLTDKQFLNKCDILQKKIHRGVRVADYISSYGDRPNDAKTVGKCASPISTFTQQVELMQFLHGRYRSTTTVQRYFDASFPPATAILLVLHVRYGKSAVLVSSWRLFILTPRYHDVGHKSDCDNCCSWYVLPLVSCLQYGSTDVTLTVREGIQRSNLRKVDLM